MHSVHESEFAAAPGPSSSDASVAGVWTLSGREMIIAEPGGPATVLVPSESVLLLAVDLPVAGRARRLAALPFAVEDRIAEPIESVHLALGKEVAPKRFLVAVVRHERMADWVDRAEEAGLGRAAMVPDALALPVPPEGAWSVDLGDHRAVVRAGDGTGFACPAAMLRPAWEAAGRPPAIAYGAPLPDEMTLAGAELEGAPLARRLAAPALDLRQGAYARRRAPAGVWRRLVWIVALGAAAHTVIAIADTAMLRVIADRRAAETRALVAAMAPDVVVDGNFATTIADMLPTGASTVPQTFLPLVARLSSALGPFGGGLAVRTMTFQADTLTLDMERGDPALATRLRTALDGARIKANVVQSPDGTIRITASPS